MVSIAVTSTLKEAVPEDPFTVTFALYLTAAQRVAQETFGGFVERIAVQRNGAVVEDCASEVPPHTDDPCVLSRTYDAARGNAVLRLSTTAFSTWTFAMPVPEVDAGGPYTATEGTPLVLAGSATGNGPVTTEWGPAAGEFADSSDPATTFTPVDDGEYTLVLEGRAADQTAASQAQVTVLNAPPVVDGLVVSPSQPAVGDEVELSVAFSDAGVTDTHVVTVDWGDGAPVVSVASSAPGGGVVSASHVFDQPGEHTVTVVVTDDDGGASSETVEVAIVAPQGSAYAFDGFGAPVSNAPVVNAVNPGRVVPMKWALTVDGGAVSDPASIAGITSMRVACLDGLPEDEVAETATGASGLQYLGEGRWQFNWATAKAWAGTCREFRLDLADGMRHVALFHFR
jgi:hypothetical protein